MKPVKEVDVDGTDRDKLVLGWSSWNDKEQSLKYAWPDKNGKRTRGGELPLKAVPQAVLFAASNEYLTRDETAALAKGLIDVLVRNAPSLS